MRYRRMGPECRPHISVVKSEVYILRHAERLHLVHLQNDVRELRFPHGGLVGVRGTRPCGAHRPVERTAPHPPVERTAFWSAPERTALWNVPPLPWFIEKP